MRFVFSLAVSLVLALSTTLAAQDRPNILFCMADDWGWPHAGAYGDRAVQTPTFDRLAREGALFHHAFVSSPSCTPSRNAFITGKYHWQLGPGANLHSTLPVEHVSFIHLLRDSGYRTGRSRSKTWGPGNIRSWQDHHGAHPATAAFATLDEFLKQGDADGTPFFFWLGTSDPHRDYQPGSGEESGIDLESVHLFRHFPDVREIRSDVADYYVEVQRWDSRVGNALETLESRGLLDNTIVIMTGDHGMPFPRCKSNLYDCGVRVPFAVRWGQSLMPGTVRNEFVSFVDIAPTLLDLAEVSIPDAMSGRSFANLVSSDAATHGGEHDRSFVVFGKERHVPSQAVPDRGGYPCRGIRTEHYLYIRNYTPNRWPAGTGEYETTNYPNQWYADCDGGPSKTWIILNRDRDEAHRRAFELCFAKRPAEELYDIATDPDQLVNLASDKRYTGQLNELSDRLQARLIETGDPRANDPDYAGFDTPPYLGGGGGKLPEAIRDRKN